jgi:hypothetical protein
MGEWKKESDRGFPPSRPVYPPNTLGCAISRRFLPSPLWGEGRVRGKVIDRQASLSVKALRKILAKL